MSALSDYLEQGLLNHILRGVALPTLAAANHFALFTAAPSDSGGGTEVSGGNYARVAMTRNGTNFDAAASRATQNSLAITFPAPNLSWGTVTHWGMLDASSGGNLLLHGALTLPKSIGATDPAPSWAIGAFDFSFTGDISTYLANAILEWLFRATAFPTWTSNYFSLHTGAPGLTGANEVAGGAYARSVVTRATGSWAAPGVGGASTNTNQQNFPAPSGANWGVCTDGGLWDALTTGNFLFAFSQTDKTVNDGDDAPYIAAGAASITLA